MSAMSDPNLAGQGSAKPPQTDGEPPVREPFHQHEKVVRNDVQIGWRHIDTGVMCDCPVYERSPHANSEPVMVPREVADRLKKADQSGSDLGGPDV